MKKILIVGATSSFAKEVIPVLANSNTVVTAGKKDCDVYCDVTESFKAPNDIDVIINFAASFGGTSNEEIINAHKTNSLGTLNVCLAAKKAGVKHLIIISSIFALLDEKSPYYTIYAITKKHADELAEHYCKLNKINLAIIRPSQIYGDSDDFKKHQPFFYDIIDRAQSGQDISIFGSHDPSRNYIHSADLAEVIGRVVEKETEGVYSCTQPSDVSYSQIAQLAQKIFGKGGHIIFVKDKPDIPDNIFSKDVRLYETIDYFPQISIEAGLERIMAYRQKGQK